MMLIVGKRAKHLTRTTRPPASPAIPARTKARCANSSARPRNGTWARISTAPAASGPWMVTADELPDAGKGLKIETRLNGKVMQSDNTDNMMFPVLEMLVYLTQGMTLQPGDIIFTGTPSGVGHARKPNPIWMKRRRLRDRDRGRRRAVGSVPYVCGRRCRDARIFQQTRFRMADTLKCDYDSRIAAQGLVQRRIGAHPAEARAARHDHRSSAALECLSGL